VMEREERDREERGGGYSEGSQLKTWRCGDKVGLD
jgi:hypothetical protein